MAKARFGFSREHTRAGVGSESLCGESDDDSHRSERGPPHHRHESQERQNSPAYVVSVPNVRERSDRMPFLSWCRPRVERLVYVGLTPVSLRDYCIAPGLVSWLVGGREYRMNKSTPPVRERGAASPRSRVPPTNKFHSLMTRSDITSGAFKAFELRSEQFTHTFQTDTTNGRGRLPFGHHLWIATPLECHKP